MEYPNIKNPLIDEFAVEQPTNNIVTSQIGYAVNNNITKAKIRKAKVTFIFTKEEFNIFKIWYFGDLNNGLKSFTVNWKDFEEVYFTEGSNMRIRKLGSEVYQIEGMIIEEVNKFNAKIGESISTICDACSCTNEVIEQ